MSTGPGRTIQSVAATPLLYRRTVHDKNALSLYWVRVVTRYLYRGLSMTEAVEVANHLLSAELASLRRLRRRPRLRSDDAKVP